MTDWFRSWHGAPTDPKWRTIARRANVRPGDVAAVVWLLLDRASQATPRGSVAGYDAEVIADALGYEPEEIERIVVGLHDKGVLADNAFVGWNKYQPNREDNTSTDRVRAFRDRMKRDETQRNATEQTATNGNSREDTEEIREEKKARCAQARALIFAKMIFPEDGSIEFGRWAEIARKEAPGHDVDAVASAFRGFCRMHKIEFDKTGIEKSFTTFCQKFAKRSANA